MRPIKYITDLPWWVGLLIFVIGNLILPLGLFGYIIGLVLCLFGCFTLAPLLPPDPDASPSRMPLGIALFSFVVGILHPTVLIWCSDIISITLV
jgi:hypothetical protein